MTVDREEAMKRFPMVHPRDRANMAYQSLKLSDKPVEVLERAVEAAEIQGMRKAQEAMGKRYGFYSEEWHLLETLIGNAVAWHIASPEERDGMADVETS